MGGRGNGAARNAGADLDTGFKYFLDKNLGDESLAIKDYLWENLLPLTVDYKGKEWRIMDENGIREKVLERPIQGDPESKDFVVTAEVDLVDDDTGERVTGYIFKDTYNHKKHRKFYVPYYN